ncbi:MAG: hypothetical protein HDR38_08340 [Treponema sp.]|nr:hypothetical protein [Treponema sp.]
MEIRYRIAAKEDLTEICDLFNSAIDTMIRNKIFQWDEIYPTEQDFREDIAKEQLYVGVAEVQLVGWGIHTIRLDAFSENPYALRLYEHMGYVKVGTADWRKGMFYLMEKHFDSL